MLMHGAQVFIQLVTNFTDRLVIFEVNVTRIIANEFFVLGRGTQQLLGEHDRICH